jgi:hypothetical protein
MQLARWSSQTIFLLLLNQSHESSAIEYHYYYFTILLIMKIDLLMQIDESSMQTIENYDRNALIAQTIHKYYYNI